MAGLAKCTHCGNGILNVFIDDVQALVPFGTQWNAITYRCPSCNVLLGVGIDPIAIKTDIVEEILHALGRR